MQAAAGNRAVQRLVAGIQGQDSRPKGSETGLPPPPRFSGEQRTRLELEVASRLQAAYVEFVRASAEIRHELREAGEAAAELVTASVGVFLGPVTPLARTLVRNTPEALPAPAPQFMERLALSPLTHEEAIGNAAFEEATEPAEETVARNLGLETTATDAYVSTLRSAFREVIDKIEENFEQVSDLELYVMWANYSPRLATYQYYLEALQRLVERERHARRERLRQRQAAERRGAAEASRPEHAEPRTPRGEPGTRSRRP